MSWRQEQQSLWSVLPGIRAPPSRCSEDGGAGRGQVGPAAEAQLPVGRHRPATQATRPHAGDEGWLQKRRWSNDTRSGEVHLVASPSPLARRIPRAQEPGRLQSTGA